MGLGILSIFLTIDGECNHWGPGVFSVFVRTRGCRVGCHWCDTKYSWAHKGGAMMTAEEVFTAVNNIGRGTRKVTITGGEPLEQDHVELAKLIRALLHNGFNVTVETAGVYNTADFRQQHGLDSRTLSFVVDYKLDSSKFNGSMSLWHFWNLRHWDTIKFVVDSEADFRQAAEVVADIRRTNYATPIYFSPSHGKVTPITLFHWMRRNGLQLPPLDVRFNLQQHKYIFAADVRDEEEGGLDFTKRTLGRDGYLERAHTLDTELRDETSPQAKTTAD